jgi:hypothetical protein
VSSGPTTPSRKGGHGPHPAGDPGA